MPSSKLIERDKAELQDYFYLTGLAEQVEYTDELDFLIAPEDLMIVDEADYFIMNFPDKFAQVARDARCIGMTATAINEEGQSIENEIFGELGFQLFDYCPWRKGDKACLAIDKELDLSGSDKIA